MFGSLRISSCRLRDDLRETYRASFCGTCHGLREFGGRTGSLLTSYDATVLTLVATGLSSTPTAVERRPCTALPFRRVPVTAPPPRLERYIAAVLIALAAAKMRDDIDDGQPLRGRVGLALLGVRTERAFAALEELGARDVAAMIRALPERQRAVEAACPGPSLAASAAPIGEAMGAVFASLATLSDRPATAKTLRRFGETLGHFVYLWDATVDFARDLRKRRFNALAAAFATTDPTAFDHPSSERTILYGALRTALDACAIARAQLHLHSQGAVLDALIASLRGKIQRRLDVVTEPSTARNASRTEAGDCDVCAGEACCGECSCCGEASASEAGGGCCSCCDCVYIDCCCCESKEKRRQKRKQEQRSHDPDDEMNLVR